MTLLSYVWILSLLSVQINGSKYIDSLFNDDELDSCEVCERKICQDVYYRYPNMHHHYYKGTKCREVSLKDSECKETEGIKVIRVNDLVVDNTVDKMELLGPDEYWVDWR